MAADVEPKVKYGETTLEGMSDVLFRKGILRTDDPAAIEEYIRIHECGLYEQYMNDDFSWNRIREAYARELQLRLPTLPDGIEIVSALPLGQYNLATNEFEISSGSKFERMAYITVMKTEGGSYDACSHIRSTVFVPRVHPLELNVKIDVPLTLTGIPITQEVANKLIDEMNKRQELTEERKRTVTLVMRIRVTNVDPLSSVTDPLRRTILGLIDDLRIYESPERKQLLFRRDYQTQREKDQKKKQQ